jgi:3-methyladenine DNA glycosylase AlkC
VSDLGRADYEQQCIQEALDVIEQYGQTDGDHHKAWVIDQVLRALTDDGYDAWVTAYSQDGEYEWDEGIAP